MAKARFGGGSHFRQSVVRNQEKQITLVVRVGENGSDPNAGADGDFPGGGFVEPVADKQLTRRVLDAPQLVGLVPFAQACRILAAEAGRRLLLVEP